MKKKNLFVGLGIVSFVLVSTLVFVNRNETYKRIPDDKKKLIAMYIEDEDGNYQASTDGVFPTDGYVLNTDKTFCKNGGVITQDSGTKALSLQVDRQDECTIYFSKNASFPITLNDYTLSWESVDGADSYKVYADDKVLTTTEDTSVELYEWFENSGYYRIKVNAIKNNKVLATSNEVNYNIDKTVVLYECGESKRGETDFLDIDIPNNVQYVNVEYKDKSIRKVPFNGVIYEEVWDGGLGYEYQNMVLEYQEEHNKILLTSGCNVDCYFKLQFIVPGEAPSDWITCRYEYIYCFDENTLVYVYNRKKKKFKKKKAKNVTYDDELLAWDFDNGCFTTAKPIWIMPVQTSDEYNEIKFSNGSVLRTLNPELGHRIFNKEKGAFTYPMSEDTPIGTTTFTASGEEVKLVSKERVHKEIQYTNIITARHLNLFTNDILTSCRLNNMYKIEDMKFVKDDREIRPLSEFKNIDKEWYEALRIGEQPENINKDGASYRKDIEEYVNNLKKSKRF